MSEYRLVCTHRTGSTFLTNYIEKFYNVKSEYEFLLDRHILHDDGTITNNNTAAPNGLSIGALLKKLDYLEATKLGGVNFQVKIIPNMTAKFGIENRLTNKKPIGKLLITNVKVKVLHLERFIIELKKKIL